MVALPKPRPAQQDIDRFQKDVEASMRQLVSGETGLGDPESFLGFGESAPVTLPQARESTPEMRRQARQFSEGLAMGLTTDLLGLPADLLALILRDAPNLAIALKESLSSGTPVMEEMAVLAASPNLLDEAVSAVQDTIGADALAKSLLGKTEEELQDPGLTTGRLGAAAFDPFLLFGGSRLAGKGLGSLRQAPGTEVREAAPVVREEPTLGLETGTTDLGPVGAPDAPSTTVPGLSDLPQSEVTGLPVLRTEVTERMATPEETAAFIRGEDPAQFAPGAQAAAETDMDDFASIMQQIMDEDNADGIMSLVSNDRTGAADVAGEILNRSRGGDLGAAADPVNETVLNNVRSQLADEAEMFVERHMGLELNELTPDTPVTVYRVGDVEPGEVQSFSLSRDVENMELPGQQLRERRGEDRQPVVEYTVRAGDILAAPNASLRPGRGTEGELEVLIDSANVTPTQTIEGDFTATPATAPEAEEAGDLFDAAAQARALDNVEEAQQVAPTQQMEPVPEVGIGTTRAADEAMGPATPEGPSNNWDSNQSIGGYQRNPDRKSQNMVYTVDDTGQYGEKVDNFSPVLTNLHAQEELGKIPANGIKPSELDKRLLQGAMKSEYKNTAFQDELLRLADEGNGKISSTDAIQLAERLLPQVRSRLFRTSKLMEEYDAGVSPFGRQEQSHLGKLDDNGQIEELYTTQVSSDVKNSAIDNTLITFSTNKPNNITFSDGSVIEDIPSVITFHGYGFEKVPNFFGWSRGSIVRTPDNKNYLVVNEIQSNAIRDYESGSGIELPPEKYLDVEVEDADGNLVETVRLQNNRSPFKEVDTAGQEVTDLLNRVNNEGNRIRPGMKAGSKRQKVKTFDDRLNMFFESEASQGAGTSNQTYGEAGRVRIPWDEEAKKFQKTIDEFWPEELTKDKVATEQLNKLLENRDKDKVLLSSSNHPLVHQSGLDDTAEKMEKLSFFLNNRQEIMSALPTRQDVAFFTGLEDAKRQGFQPDSSEFYDASFDLTNEYVGQNSDYIETVVEELLRREGRPTTVDSVNNTVREFSDFFRTHVQEYLRGEYELQDFENKFLRSYGNRSYLSAENKLITVGATRLQATALDSLVKQKENFEKALYDPSPETLDMFENATVDERREYTNSLFETISDQELEKVVTAVQEESNKLVQKYGDAFLNQNVVDTPYVKLLIKDALDGYQNEITGSYTDNYRRKRILDLVDSTNKINDLFQSGDVLSEADKTRLLNEATEKMEASGIDMDKVKAFQKVKELTGNGRNTGFIMPTPFKDQSDFFKYATRSIIKNAREQEGIDGVVFLSGKDHYDIHMGSSRDSIQAYENSYGKAVDKALKEFEDSGGKVRRNVNKRDDNGNLVDPNVEKLFFVEPGIAGDANGQAQIFTSKGEGLRIVDFGDDNNVNATMRPIRRAKGGEVDLRPQKMIHSGIGAMAREVM